MESNKEYFSMAETSAQDEDTQSQEDQHHDEPEGRKVCCCVVLREGYGLPQFLMMVIGLFSTFYAMFTAVLFLVLLITSPRYFNVQKEESGQSVSAIILATEVVNIAVFLVVGLLYDTIGRRPLLVTGEILTAVFILCLPYSGSVLPGLLLSRCGIAISTSVILGSPLLVDYIHDKSKGITMAVMGLVGGLSVILVTVVELKLAQSHPLEVFFYPPSVLCLLTALAMYFFLKEPP